MATSLSGIHRNIDGSFCQKHYGVSSSILFTGFGTVRILAFLKVKVTRKGKCFGSIEGIELGVTTQLKRIASECGRNDGIRKCV